MLRPLHVTFAFALLGCGGSELPTPEAPATLDSPATAAPVAPTASAAPTASSDPNAPCASVATCRETASRASDSAEKVLHFGRACDLGDGQSCTDAAQAIVDRPGKKKGSELFPYLEKGCNAKTGTSCNGLGQLFHEAGDETKAEAYFSAGCDTGHGTSCHNLATLMLGGFIKMDRAALERTRKRACDAGVKEDCGPPQKPTGAAASETVPDATLTVGSMTTDGIRVESLSCRVDGLGILGAAVIVGTLSKQKAALRTCGVSTPVPVTWAIKGGSVTSASANTGDAKKDACVVGALKKVRSTSDGPCAARIGLE